MRISDWSSDVCSSDLAKRAGVLSSPGCGPDRHKDSMWIWRAPLDESLKRAHFLRMKIETASRPLRQHEMAIRAGGYAATLVLIAGATLAGLLIAPRWGSGTVALLLLPPVLVAAAICGREEGRRGGEEGVRAWSN